MFTSLLHSILFILGFLIGAFDSVISGGNLFIIALLNILNVNSVSAIATMQAVTLLQTFSGFIGFARKKLINWRQTLPLCFTSMIGGFIGVNLTLSIQEKHLSLISGVLMIILLFFIPQIKLDQELVFPFKIMKQLFGFLLKKRNKLMSDRRETIMIHLTVFVISIYGGFFGAGVGVMLLIFVSFLSHKNISVVLANTKLIDVVLSLLASSFFISQQGLIAWNYFFPLAIGSTIGSFLGVTWAHEIDIWLVRTALYLVVILSAFHIFYKYFSLNFLNLSQFITAWFG